MSAAKSNRAAAIRHYLDGMGADPTTARRYSLVAARWEALRLAIDRGHTTPGTDDRFRELTPILKALTVELGLGPEVTGWKGFLSGDPERIICDTWQEAADGW
jgi:hypothetical protein